MSKPLSRRKILADTVAAAGVFSAGTFGASVFGISVFGTSAFGTSAFAAPAGRDSAGDPAAQWWGWRGPNANNHAGEGNTIPDDKLQTRIAWSIDIPGRGHSSPIVVGDALYMATAVKETGTQAILKISQTGKAVWAVPVHQGGLPSKNHPKNTEASSTLAFDGEGLLASFYNNDAIRMTRLTLDGKIVWQKEIGRYQPKQYKYGYAASPLIYGDSVIVVGDYDGPGFLASLNSRTGEENWKIKRPGKLSFSSPIVANIGGRDQLLLSGNEMVAAYDPATGRVLWKTDNATTMATCGTMVWDDSRVFASGGYPKAGTVAIAADGSGRVLWSNPTKCYEQSMLIHGGNLFAVSDSGVAYCWDAEDGTERWKKRLGGNYSSSPILVGDVIHVFNENGEGFAFTASAKGFEARGRSKVGDETFASPVVVDSTMYLRVAKTDRSRQESLLAIL